MTKSAPKKRKFMVTYLVDATTHVIVEAKSAEEAMRLADAVVVAPHVCHQCSDHIEVGDIIDMHTVEEMN